MSVELVAALAVAALIAVLTFKACAPDTAVWAALVADAAGVMALGSVWPDTAVLAASSVLSELAATAAAAAAAAA